VNIHTEKGKTAVPKFFSKKSKKVFAKPLVRWYITKAADKASPR
jgi:hypothetical protein